MSKAIKVVFFHFRYIFKSMIKTPMKSFLVLFSMCILSLVLILGMSVDFLVTKYYYDQLEDTYGDIDFSMGIQMQSQARYFSIRPFNQANLTNAYFEKVIPFFEIDALIEIQNDQSTYVRVMSSSFEQLKKITVSHEFSIQQLLANEIIITQTLSDMFHLNTQDSINMRIGSSIKTFMIKEIIKDEGLFNDQTIFVNKSDTLSLFLTAINPAFAGLHPSLLTNFYNKIYFEVKHDVQISDAIHALLLISEYEHLKYHVVIDEVAIQQLISRAVSAFYAVVSLIVCAIIFLMFTTWMLWIHDKKRDYAIMHMLGGKPRFNQIALNLEMMFYMVLSISIAYVSANELIKYAMLSIGSKKTYQVQWQTIYVVCIILFIVMLVTSIMYYVHTQKISLISLSKIKEKNFEIRKKIFLTALLISFMLMILTIFKWLPKALKTYETVIFYIASLTVIILLIVLFFRFLLSRLSSDRLKNIDHFYQKMIYSKKAFYAYVCVIFICFTVVFLLVMSQNHVKNKVDIVQNEYQVDFGLLNLVSRYEQTYQEIITLDGVKQADKVGLFQNIKFSHEYKSIQLLVSLQADEIKTYFNLNIPEKSLTALKTSEKLVIILPERYHLLEDYHVGDVIYLDIHPQFIETPFEIAGFFEKEVGILAFTNLHDMPIYQAISTNAIFVNALEEKEVLKQTLLDLYSPYMIYIVDYEAVLVKFTTDIHHVNQLIEIIIMLMLVSFFFAIVIYGFMLFEELKLSYVRLYILGLSKQNLYKLLIKDSLRTYAVILTGALLAFYLITSRLQKFVLLFNEFENFPISINVYLEGILWISLVFVLARIIYMHKIATQTYQETLRA